MASQLTSIGAFFVTLLLVCSVSGHSNAEVQAVSLALSGGLLEIALADPRARAGARGDGGFEAGAAGARGEVVGRPGDEGEVAVARREQAFGQLAGGPEVVDREAGATERVSVASDGADGRLTIHARPHRWSPRPTW